MSQMAAALSKSTDYSVRIFFFLSSIAPFMRLLVLGHGERVLYHVEEFGVGIGPTCPRAVPERVVLVTRLQHVCRSMAEDRSHQPKCACCPHLVF